VRSIDRRESEQRRASIEQLIDDYRAARHRQLLERAIKLWRRAEAQQQLAQLDGQSEHVH
jgi:hypothetical protein